MQPSPKDTMATRYIAINEIREINDFQEKNSDRKSSHAIFLYDGLDKKRKERINDLIDHFSVDGLKISKMGFSSCNTNSTIPKAEVFLNVLEEKIKSGEIGSDTIIFMNFHTYADNDNLFFSIKGIESNLRIRTDEVYQFVWSFFPGSEKPSFHNLGCNTGYYSEDLANADGYVINYSGASPIGSKESILQAKEVLRFVTIHKKICGGMPRPEEIWQHMEHYVTQEMSIVGQGIHKNHKLITPRSTTTTTTATISTTTTTTTTTTTNSYGACKGHKNPKTLIEYSFRHRSMNDFLDILDIHDPKYRAIGKMSENAKNRILFHIVPNRVPWLKSYESANMPLFLVELLAHNDSEQKFLFCKEHNLFPNPIGEEKSTRFLIAACEDGNPKVVRRVFESPEFSISDSGKKTALMAAIKSRNKELIELLINQVSDFDQRDTNLNTVYHLACRQNNLEIIELLLKREIPSKLTTNSSNEKNTSTADLLNQRNKHNSTPLEIAIKKNNIEIVKRLLAAGANPHILNSKGIHLLEQAVFIGNASIMKLLLASEPRESKNFPDLALLLRTAILQSHDEIAMMLIAHCAATSQISEIDKPNESGATPLMLATYKQNTKLLRTLIESGANINAQNNEGHTVFHYVLKNRDKNMSKYLMKKGMDLSGGDFNFSSALALARNSGDSVAEEYIRSAMNKRNAH